MSFVEIHHVCYTGVNRHFHMICIRDKFSQNLGRQVSSKVIWEHLSTMYDMQALVSIHCRPNLTLYTNCTTCICIAQSVRTHIQYTPSHIHTPVL